MFHIIVIVCHLFKGVRRVSRSPRYLESVHGPSVHSAPSSQSWCIKQEHDEDNSISKQTTELLSGSRQVLWNIIMLKLKLNFCPFQNLIEKWSLFTILSEPLSREKELLYPLNYYLPETVKLILLLIFSSLLGRYH